MVFLIRKSPEGNGFFDDTPRPSNPNYSSSDLPNLSPLDWNEEGPPSPPIFIKQAAPVERYAGKPLQIKPAESVPTKSVEKEPIIRERIVPQKIEKTADIVMAEKRILPKKPLFVNVGDYQGVLASTSSIKSTIDEAEKILARLQEIKTEQEKEFAKWRVVLEEVERKLEYVDKVIFEG